jgi:hypothetical protein
MSAKKDNLAFWDAFSTTDPKYSKNANVTGQKRTTVSAQYKKRNITSAFGMYGKDWGVETGSEEYERTHFENQTCILHYRAVAFYVFDGDRYTFPIASSVKESYVVANKGYLKIDDEAVKKVRTDALTKGFTDLGFNSDVHMGEFDDQDYVAGAAAKAEIDKQEKEEEATAEAIERIKEYCKKEVESADAIKNDNAYIAAMNRIMAKVETRCRAAGLKPTSFTKGFLDTIEKRKAKGANNAS